MTLATRTAMIISGLAGRASGLTHELTTRHAVLRAPLAQSRPVGVVHLRGGAGASTTAAYVASLLARRRTGMVLAVNASAGERQVLSQAGVPSPTRSRDAAQRLRPGSAADARAGLGVSGTGLYGLDLTRDRLSAGAGTWFEQVSTTS